MKNISNLHKEIGDKYNVSPETVSKIEYHVFQYIAKHMKERRAGSILIHNFGTVSASLIKTNREIQKFLNLWRAGNIDREEAKEMITKLWILRNEALKQNKSSNE